MLLWMASFLAVLHQIPLPSAPSWESLPGFFSTGGGVADLNGDGKPDLCVSNGNDMEAEPNHVFYQQDSLLFSPAPDWASTDTLFSGHLALGDINGDGAMDLVVANYSGAGPWLPQRNVLYLNTGEGLSPTPSWEDPFLGRSFGVALGDVDGDGRPDALFASGEIYSQQPEPSRLYLARNGTLDTLPAWTSSPGYALSAVFLDVDRDGDLDLVLGVEGGSNRLYLNHDGVLDTLPAWQSDEEESTNQITAGDLNGDGWVDLVVSNTYGASNVKVYLNIGGTLETTASWVAYAPFQYASTVALGDVDGDGDLDLAAGGWWDPVVVFENLGGTLSPVPAWSWEPFPSSGLVGERVLFADVDQDGLETRTETHFLVPPAHVFYLEHVPFHTIEEVLLNGTPLSPADYCASPELGWVSINRALLEDSSEIQVTYTYSTDLDLLVTNWEPSRGNFLFLNEGTVVVAEKPRSSKAGGIVRWSEGVLSLDLPVSFSHVRLALYRPDGRRVAVLHRGVLSAGRHRFPVPSLPAGVYLLRLDAPSAHWVWKLARVGR